MPINVITAYVSNDNPISSSLYNQINPDALSAANKDSSTYLYQYMAFHFNKVSHTEFSLIYGISKSPSSLFNAKYVLRTFNGANRVELIIPRLEKGGSYLHAFASFFNKIGSDDNYDYYLFNLMGYIVDANVYISRHLVVRVVKGVEILTDNTITLPQALVTTYKYFYETMDDISSQLGTSTWYDNSTGEIGVKAINNNFLNYSPERYATIFGYNPNRQSFFIVKNSSLIEEWHYDVTTNTFIKLSSVIASFNGTIHRVAYDFNLNYIYALQYETGSGYKLVAYDTENELVHRVSTNINYDTTQYASIVGASSVLKWAFLDLAVIPGAVIILIDNIVDVDSRPKSPYISALIVNKPTFSQIDVIEAIYNYTGDLDYNLSSINIGPKYNYIGRDVMLGGTSLVNSTKIDLIHCDMIGNYHRAIFLRSDASDYLDVDYVPRDVSRVSFDIDATVTITEGIMDLFADDSLRINPDAWMIPPQGFDITPTVEGYNYKLEVYASFIEDDFNLNLIGYSMYSESSYIELDILAGINTIGVDLEVTITSEILGVVVDSIGSWGLFGIALLGIDSSAPNSEVFSEYDFSIYSIGGHFFSEGLLEFLSDTEYYDTTDFTISAYLLSEGLLIGNLKTLSNTFKLYGTLNKNIEYGTIDSHIDLDIESTALISTPMSFSDTFIFNKVYGYSFVSSFGEVYDAIIPLKLFVNIKEYIELKSTKLKIPMYISSKILPSSYYNFKDVPILFGLNSFMYTSAIDSYLESYEEAMDMEVKVVCI